MSPNSSLFLAQSKQYSVTSSRLQTWFKSASLSQDQFGHMPAILAPHVNSNMAVLNFAMSISSKDAGLHTKLSQIMLSWEWAVGNKPWALGSGQWAVRNEQ
jgi:hypothetical protein